MTPRPFAIRFLKFAQDALLPLQPHANWEQPD